MASTVDLSKWIAFTKMAWCGTRHSLCIHTTARTIIRRYFNTLLISSELFFRVSPIFVGQKVFVGQKGR